MPLKKLFDDFNIDSSTHAIFSLELLQDNIIQYVLIGHETENNRIFLEHIKTGKSFSVPSKSDHSILNEIAIDWCKHNDLDSLIKNFNGEYFL